MLNPNPLLVIRGDGLTEFRGFIRESIMIRSFDDLPIEITGLDDTLIAAAGTPNGNATGSLRLEGTQRIMENYTPLPGMLFVDVSEIDEPGTYTLPVQVDIPEGFTLSRQEPLELELEISLKEEGEEE
jgi:hypothetical protein